MTPPTTQDHALSDEALARIVRAVRRWSIIETDDGGLFTAKNGELIAGPYTGSERHTLLAQALAEDIARAAWSASPGPGMAEALERYRAATHWIGADSWDGCSDCMDILKAATQLDPGRGMDPNELAGALKRLRLAWGLKPHDGPVSTGVGLARFLLEHVKLRLEARAEVMGERGVTMSPGLTRDVLQALEKGLGALAPAAVEPSEHLFDVIEKAIGSWDSSERRMYEHIAEAVTEAGYRLRGGEGG